VPISGDDPYAVGPVLTPGPLTDAVIAAIRALNADVSVIDRGGYLRVLVPGRCRLNSAAVKTPDAVAFRLPADLEAIMPSFRGRLSLVGDEALWEAVGRWSS
jgi:toluene monooxygenase system protein D